MTITIILFVLGFILLIKGADILIDGSSSIAKKFGLSAFFIGLTVVAFGTSAPELVVSVTANFSGSSGIALGNIIGSNIANTLLILGIAAIIAPLVIKRRTVHKEIPYSLLAILAVGILSNDFLIDHISPDGLNRIDGLMLLLFFSIFIFYTFGISKEEENIFQKTVGEIKNQDQEEYSMLLSVGMILLGLLGLVLGGKWIVNGAIQIAEYFELSQALIGLTIVAIGTSLPELAASGMAAYRGRTDMAVGNVVGSNIFNFLLVLGVSSTISPIRYNTTLNIDILILLVITIMLLPLVYIGRKNIIGRWEGIVLVSLFVCYFIFIFFRG